MNGDDAAAGKPHPYTSRNLFLTEIINIWFREGNAQDGCLGPTDGHVSNRLDRRASRGTAPVRLGASLPLLSHF